MNALAKFRDGMTAALFGIALRLRYPSFLLADVRDLVQGLRR